MTPQGAFALGTRAACLREKGPTACMACMGWEAGMEGRMRACLQCAPYGVWCNAACRGRLGTQMQAGRARGNSPGLPCWPAAKHRY